MMEKSTETADPKSYKTMNSRLIAVDSPRDHGTKLGPPYAGDSGEPWIICEEPDSRTRIYLWCIC